ncbi:MAG: hypothetical protein AAFU66_06240 [Pseudomonadota bacterium]
MHSNQRVRSLAGAVALACVGLGGCAAQTASPTFDPSISAVAASTQQSIETLPPSTSSAMELAARLTTADSRLGTWLLTGGDLHNRLYMSRLRERGYENVIYRIAYPSMTDRDPRAAEYSRFYAWLDEQIRNYGMQSLVKLSLQYRDDNYFRGVTLTEQCQDLEQTATAFARFVDTVGEVSSAQTLVLDLRPSAMAITPGCEAWADSTRAIALTETTLARVGAENLNRVAVGVDLVEHPVYREWVLSHPMVKTVSISTLDYKSLDVEEFLAAWNDLANAIDTRGKTAISDAFWLRKPVTLASCESSPLAMSDAAVVWAPVDEALVQRLGDRVRLTALHETDLLFGGYLPADEFQCGEGFFIKNRRLSQLASRQSRRYAAPTDDASSD